MRAILLLALALAPLAATLPGVAEACPGLVLVPGQGRSCPVEGGWEVVLGDGTRVFTHGPDPAGGNPLPLTAPPPPADPVCTTQVAEWAIRVLYVHPSDKPDASAGKVAAIRDMVRQVNGLVRAEAAGYGETIDLRVYCRSGTIEVLSLRLPTPSGQDSFETIITDLRRAGMNGNSQKYLVYYDDTVPCACAGQANFYQDDRLAPENQNNSPTGGSSRTTFAVLYATTDAGVAAHELFHVLGAVQRSAPHATAANHCTDGLDVMCWEDGSGAYSATSCMDRTRLDCNGDDWFRPYAPRGTYLASHWNVGSHLVKFLEFGAERDPPAVAWVVPQAGWVHEGCTERAEWVSGRAAFRRDGCISLALSDESGIARVELRVGGILIGVDTSGSTNPVFTFPVTRLQLGTMVELEVMDLRGNHAKLTRYVDMLLV